MSGQVYRPKAGESVRRVEQTPEDRKEFQKQWKEDREHKEKLKEEATIKKWKDKEYAEEVKYSCRIYPQDNDSEGFFIAKLRKEK